MIGCAGRGGVLDKILIVDDDQSMRYSLNRMLEGQGLFVSLARNGVEALERFDLEKPDLVVMDIKMPGQSGLEVLRQIKERDPKALVILMTAFGTTETAIEAMKYGAFDYILKPFDIPQMRGAGGTGLGSFADDEKDGLSAGRRRKESQRKRPLSGLPQPCSRSTR